MHDKLVQLANERDAIISCLEKPSKLICLFILFLGPREGVVLEFCLHGLISHIKSVGGALRYLWPDNQYLSFHDLIHPAITIHHQLPVASAICQKIKIRHFPRSLKAVTSHYTVFWLKTVSTSSQKCISSHESEMSSMDFGQWSMDNGVGYWISDVRKGADAQTLSEEILWIAEFYACSIGFLKFEY